MSYDTDLFAWCGEQAGLLRRIAAGDRINDGVDWLNIAEEIESLGVSQRRELRSRLRVILEHLVKLQTSPSSAPRAGWEDTIEAQRSEIEAVLADSPSLRPAIPALIAEELPNARKLAVRALARHGEAPTADPASLSYTVDQVLGPWLP